jgi:hypothetical protein
MRRTVEAIQKGCGRSMELTGTFFSPPGRTWPEGPDEGARPHGYFPHTFFSRSTAISTRSGVAGASSRGQTL